MHMDGNLGDFMSLRCFDDPPFDRPELLAPALFANLASDLVPTAHDLDHEEWNDRSLLFISVFGTHKFQGCNGPNVCAPRLRATDVSFGLIIFLNCDQVIQQCDSRRCSHCQSVYYCSRACQKKIRTRSTGRRVIPSVSASLKVRASILVSALTPTPCRQDLFGRRDRLFMGALAQ
jgi:hypothetical protein